MSSTNDGSQLQAGKAGRDAGGRQYAGQAAIRPRTPVQATEREVSLADSHNRSSDEGLRPHEATKRLLPIAWGQRAGSVSCIEPQ